MARTKKKNLTRYERMTRKELWALPEAELEEIWEEHVEELNRRGDLNENATEEGFLQLLDKACAGINKTA